MVCGRRSANASLATANRACPATSPTGPCSSARACRRIWGRRTHLVHYPLRRGELYNLVAVFHSDHYEEGWNAEGSKDLLWQHFKGQCPEVLRMLERIETWRMWVLCAGEPVKNWTLGRVTLLGDAAHPMLQYLRQGACMGAEGEVLLAEKARAQPDDLLAAFNP